MWWVLGWKEIAKTVGPAILMIVGVIAVLVIASIVSRSCSPPTSGPDYLEDMKRGILTEVDRERKENEARLKVLEAELYDLRLQVDTLDEEVRASAEEREEIHDAIDHASSIDDIDRILRGGIPGVSGRRDN